MILLEDSSYHLCIDEEEKDVFILYDYEVLAFYNLQDLGQAIIKPRDLDQNLFLFIIIIFVEMYNFNT